MDPVGSSTGNQNKSMRPKHFWDMRAAPATDGCGPQDQYADAVDG